MFRIIHVSKFCIKFGNSAWNLFIWLSGKSLSLLQPDVKCTKCNFGWGSAPDPTWGSLQRSPDLLAGFKGPTYTERGKWVGNGRVGWGEETEECKGKEEGSPRVGSKSWKYPVCRTDLIGGGGTIDVCPGRQIPLRRHCTAIRTTDVKVSSERTKEAEATILRDLATNF